MTGTDEKGTIGLALLRCERPVCMRGTIRVEIFDFEVLVVSES